MLDFIKKAYSQNGEPSSSRLHTGFAVYVLTSALAYGMWKVCAEHVDLILPYSYGLIGLVAGALGIQAVKAIKAPQQDAAPEAQPTDQPTQ